MSAPIASVPLGEFEVMIPVLCSSALTTMTCPMLSFGMKRSPGTGSVNSAN
jgi:hypothetical protein